MYELKMVLLCILQVHCCGVNSYTDWRNITWYSVTVRNAVPLSCCAEVGGCERLGLEYLTLAPNGGIENDVKVWTTVSIRIND